MSSTTQSQNSSDVSSRETTSTMRSDAVMINPTLSSTSSAQNNNGAHMAVSSVNQRVPSNYTTENATSVVMNSNDGANDRGRTDNAVNVSTRDNTRTRSSSGNRRRNRRRRRRTRSAGTNGTSNRTNCQHIDQNELQQTTLAGNYNTRRNGHTINASSTGNASASVPNRTSSSATVNGSLDGPEEEATKCQVNYAK